MYVWIACDLSESLSRIREECIALNKTVGASEIAFDLPQHISLKISFELNEESVENAILQIKEYLENTPGFYVGRPYAEFSGNIIWLRFPDSEQLCRMHEELDEMLLDRYGVPLHSFDKCFAFHSTLFIDADKEKLVSLYRRINEITLPDSIKIDSFIIGVSESGKAGEYRVVDIIPAKSK